VKDCFEALASIAVTFAEHGPGLMPNEANMVVEREYIRYRENYNSFWYQEHAYFPFKPYRVWIDMFNSHLFLKLPPYIYVVF